MMSFWQSPLGGKITGTPDKAFVQDFTPLPEGTHALASIKSCKNVQTEQTAFKEAERFIEVIYYIVDGDFKGREVKQKIRCYSGKPTTVDKALNMLMLLMKLCDYKPSHSEEPSDQDLSMLCNKIVGIVVGEWQIPANDGGVMEGNFVREVHPSAGFECKTGVKRDSPTVPAQSNVSNGFDPNAPASPAEDDVPF